MDVNAKKAPIFLLLAISIASTAVFASVFVYYPVSIAATPQAPPIIFSSGSNSNANDLRGQQITVSISQANTSLSITVHPTYQTTYYKNITVINNTDTSNPYYIAFRVNSAATDTNLESANLIIKDSSGNQVATIDLKSSTTSNWSQIPKGAHYSVDLQIIYSAGSNDEYNQDPGRGFTASLQLIYSPQNTESAP